MADPLSLCLEDLEAPEPVEDRVLQCVALVGRQPGLGLDESGRVVWKTRAGLVCELDATADGRLALLRVSPTAAVALERAGRRTDLVQGKPVAVLAGDVLAVAGRRLRVHLRGPATAVAPPQPLPPAAPAGDELLGEIEAILAAPPAPRPASPAPPPRPASPAPPPAGARRPSPAAAAPGPAGTPDPARLAEEAIRGFVDRAENRQALARGRKRGGLRSLFAADIARARAAYEARVAPGTPGRDAVFEKALVRVLADGNPVALG